MKSCVVLAMVLAVAFAAPTVQHYDTSDAMNAFSFDYLRSLNDSSENEFFSAPSMSIAFSMLAAGAQHETLKQLSSTFRFELTDGEIHEETGKVLQALAPRTASNTSYEFSLANKLYFDQTLSLKEQFKNILKNHYNAAFEQVNFGRFAPEITNKINKWVKNETKGMIKGVFGRPLPSSTIAVLLNAIYFKGQWASKFDTKNTKPMVFFGTKYNASVDMMYQNTQVETASIGQGSILRLKYIGGASMYFIYPSNEKGNLSEVIGYFDHHTLDKLFYIPGKARIYVPKFKLERTYDLLENLERLGLKDLGNLGGIADDDIFVDKAIHKAIVEVNEEGTKAAAVTAIFPMIRTRSYVRYNIIILNRPFAFIIRDDATGINLFTGRINNLKKE